MNVLAYCIHCNGPSNRCFDLFDEKCYSLHLSVPFHSELVTNVPTFYTAPARYYVNESDKSYNGMCLAQATETAGADSQQIDLLDKNLRCRTSSWREDRKQTKKTSQKPTIYY